MANESYVENPDQKAEAVSNGAASPFVMTLRKSIIANGDEVNSLTFREPTAADIERVGNPVLMDMMSGETPKISFDAKVMTQMMSILAVVPPSSIRQMHPRDWNTVAWSLANFFLPEF